MFPLVSKTYPNSFDRLAAEIRDSLAAFLTFANPASAVKVEGSAWPVVERMAIDLDNASVRVAQPPPKPSPVGAKEPGINIKQLRVSGHPIWHLGSKLDLEFSARGVRADFTHDSNGRAMLMFADIDDGHVELKIGNSDLQSALLAAASEAAKSQGVTIQDLQIHLAGDGQRSLAVEVRVKAKKMMMSGSIVVRGKVDVDSNLVARIYNLSCTGEGMVGNIAAGMVNIKLRLFEGKQVPLTSLSLGDVKLHDIRITTEDPIVVRAEFGK